MFTLIDDNTGYDPYNSADRKVHTSAMWQRINRDPANAWILDALKDMRNERDANRAMAEKLSGPESMFHVKQAE